MCSPDNVIVCPVGEFFDCKSREKRCRSCTNAPSGATYVSAGIPATENDCDWTCDGCETVDIAWYMGPALSLSVLPWILGWCGFVLVSGLVAMMITKDRRLSIGMKCLLFTSFLFFDYAYMGSRFHWLLNSEDAQFKTMKTPEGEYIWIGPEFRSSSRSQRSQLGCNFSLAELEPAPEDACKVWWVSFNADMDFQGNNWIEGAAKVSVGVGLCIFAYVASRSHLLPPPLPLPVRRERERCLTASLPSLLLRLPRRRGRRNVLRRHRKERRRRRGRRNVRRSHRKERRRTRGRCNLRKSFGCHQAPAAAQQSLTIAPAAAQQSLAITHALST